MKTPSSLGSLLALVCAGIVVMTALMIGPGPEDCPSLSGRTFANLFTGCPVVLPSHGKTLSPPEEILAEKRLEIVRKRTTLGSDK